MVYTRAMNTAKNDIFIGLQPEYCYLVGEINLWWLQRKKFSGGRGGVYLGNFSKWANEQIFG